LQDVLRSYLRIRAGEDRLRATNAALVDAAARLLAPGYPAHAWWTLPGASPGASAVGTSAVGTSAVGSVGAVAEHTAGYLWEHLTYHLFEADRRDDLLELAQDLRWTVAKSARPDLGPVAVDVDFGYAQAVGGDPVVPALRRAVGQAAHLLTPGVPATSFVPILVSRLDGLAEVAGPLERFAAGLTGPRLVNRWPLPDQPHPALVRVLRGHTEAITSCAAGPDGDWIASAGRDGWVWLWDARTGSSTRTWRGPGGPLVLRRTGQRELTVVALNTGAVFRWEPVTDSDAAAVADPVADPVAPSAADAGPALDACVLAPDGSWLAAVAGETVLVRRPPSARAVVSPLVGAQVSAMCAAPDGTWFATAHRDGGVRVWDAGRSHASAGGPASAPAAVPGRLELAPPAGSRPVEALACLGLTAPGLAEAGLAEAQTQTQTQTQTLTLTQTQASADGRAASDAHGTWLAVGYSDGAIRLFDPADGRLLRTLDGGVSVTSLGVVPGRSLLVSGHTTGRIRRWDLATGTPLGGFVGHPARVTVCTASAAGSLLLTGAQDDTVRTWRLDALAATATDAAPAPADRSGAAAVSPDGSWLATGGRDRCVRLWDPVGKRVTRVLGPVRGWVNALGVDPAGRWIASTHWDPRVHVWDLERGGALAVLDTSAEFVRTCAVAPDGSWLATGGSDGLVRLWDMPSGAPGHVLAADSGAVFACVAGPDGSWLATGGHTGVTRIWDVASARLVRELPAAARHVRAACAAPDGSWLATGHGDGTVRIWEVAAGRLRTLVRGHTRCVYGCAASPDGSLLATCGADGSVRIVAVATGECLTAMRVDGLLLDCAWLPDGHGVLAVGLGGVYLFDYLGGVPSA
jgi:WD40 repeat protein